MRLVKNKWPQWLLTGQKIGLEIEKEREDDDEKSNILGIFVGLFIGVGYRLREWAYLIF